jgi:mono/diheme cytochrome c family protein
MRRWAGPLGFIGLVLVVIVLLAIYGLSERRLDETYEVPEESLTLQEEGDLARGEHLVQAVSVCVDCHAEDLGGEDVQSVPLLARVKGPNLTPGEGGISERSDRDLVLAIRHALDPELKPLVVMPSHNFWWMSDADLASVIAYLRQVPPVDRDMSMGRPGAMVRLPMALGLFNLLPAAEIEHGEARPASPPEGPTTEYGDYLLYLGGCRDCHGTDLTGGMVPGSIRRGPDLTSEGAAGDLTQEEFITAMREGEKPDGGSINDIMPWRYYQGMTDEELQAMYEHLRTLP